MIVFCNIGSFLLGLMAWFIPIFALVFRRQIRYRGWFSAASFSCCGVSLLLQIFGIRERVRLEDWSALMDTVYVLSWVSAILVIVTIACNIALLCVQKKRGER